MFDQAQPHPLPEDSKIVKRDSFYLRFDSSSWYWNKPEQAIKRVVADAKDLVSKSPSNPTFVSAMLQRCSDQDAEVADSFIIGAIASNKKLVNEVGGQHQVPALHSAILAKRKALVCELMSNGANLDLADKDLKGPLHCAAEVGDLDIVEALIKNAPSTSQGVVEYLLRKFPDAQQRAGSGGRTPLHIAATHGHLNVVKMLLDYEHPTDGRLTSVKESSSSQAESLARPVASVAFGPIFDINQRTAEGRTSLHLACRGGKIEVVKFLLDRHADSTIFSYNGESCLWDAARFGHLQVVQHLLNYEALASGINKWNSSGITLLSASCATKSHLVAEELLDAGADCAIANNDGSTPFTEAITRSDCRSMSALLKSKSFKENSLQAISYKVDGEPSTALHLACQRHNLNMVRLLVRELPLKHLHESLKDVHGRTPLHEASRMGYHGIVNVLLSEGASVNETDGNGWTPLHYASHEALGYLHVPSGFRSRDASSDDYWDRDENAYGSDENYDETVKLLMGAYANVEARNRNGDTALHLAAIQGHTSRVSLLLDMLPTPPESLGLFNSQEETPLICSLKNNHGQVAKRLVTEMSKVEFQDDETRDDYLRFLIQQGEHALVASILYKEARTKQRLRLDSVTQGEKALILAAFLGSPRLVWWLLQSNASSTSLRHDIEAARLVCADEFKRCVADERACGSDQISIMKQKETNRLLQDLGDTLELLRNPPPHNERGQRFALSVQYAGARDQSSQLLNKYTVELLDLYEDQFIQHSTSLSEALYLRSPFEIMKELWTRVSNLDGSHGRLWPTPANMPREMATPNVRWIHLPANNDMAAALNGNSKVEQLDSSWLFFSGEEVTGRQERTSFMKPQCTMRSSSGSNCMAIYMPYVAPAWRGTERSLSDYKTLLQVYQEKGSLIHGTRTLDEYFYHSCTGSELDESIQVLNDDQVLTKTIHHDQTKRGTKLQVNVDHLWVWVIDKATVVTSTTHRCDWEVNPMGGAIVAALRDAMNDTEKVPKNAYEMADFIIASCINSFDTQFSMTSQDEHPIPQAQSLSVDLSASETLRVNIKEVFSDAIAKASISEVHLYNECVGDKQHKKLPSSVLSHFLKRGVALRNAAAVLSREIKDIRDEIKTIRLVAERQKTVQAEFRRIAFKTGCRFSIRNMVHELGNMDQAAERIESSIRVTLAIQHNAKAIEHARVAVGQGRHVLALTVVAIVFVPASFFATVASIPPDSGIVTEILAGALAFGMIYGFIFSGISEQTFVRLRRDVATFWGFLVRVAASTAIKCCRRVPFGGHLRRAAWARWVAEEVRRLADGGAGS
ncbi:ankyrin 2,3/unc44 [Cordyceps militaris CM01]|uniref:Ankyrin 2,3/unc44 n=1 Tax=Cordyceps militaris (strain CM01) TaxID=983644 RepID=G3JA07_CORMM|nr:ankyrin 2,3/unc44 [Cordyceps militaris CM01]EGX95027.1 ankyrin 2,3/unc44 [Cordyceps militaris CM01]